MSDLLYRKWRSPAVIVEQPKGTYCEGTWRNSGTYFPHECGRPFGHEGRHTCEHSGCRSWIGGDDE